MIQLLPSYGRHTRKEGLELRRTSATNARNSPG
jgi:hypothetical protein